MKGFLGEYGKIITACIIAALFIAFAAGEDGFLLGASEAKLPIRDGLPYADFTYLTEVAEREPPTLTVRRERLRTGHSYPALSYVTAAKDRDGVPLPVRVSGDVDERGNIRPMSAGIYEVVYYTEDGHGVNRTVRISFVAEQEGESG